MHIRRGARAGGIRGAEGDAGSAQHAGRRAGGEAAARESMIASVDAALIAYDRTTRGALPTSRGGLSDAARRAADRDERVARRAAGARILHGIPGARRTAHAGRVDGWSARSHGWSRRIGLLADGELLVRSSIEALGANGEACRATSQGLSAARARYGRLDAALVLAVAARETRGGVFRTVRGRVNVFHAGGLDHLARQMEDETLFGRDEIRGWRVARGAAANESGQTVDPVTIPRSDQIRAYAGAVEAAWRRVEDEVRAQLGPEEGQRALDALDVDARRMWIEIAFGGPFGAAYRGTDASYGRSFGIRTALGRLIERCRPGPVDLNRIVDPDPFLDAFSRVRRARVTSAEAELFEVALGRSDEEAQP